MCRNNIDVSKIKNRIYNWLILNGDIPIKYILTKESILKNDYLKNDEVFYWMEQLKQRSVSNNLDKIHGSHDYRLENILGKLYVLGLNKNISEFSSLISFILLFLQQHICNKDREAGFGAIYSNLDYELILAAYMPFFGYYDNEAVQYIARKRINLLYEFIGKNDFNIYIDSFGLKKVPKAWKNYILNPELYEDGNVKLPFRHDIILFAGIYQYLEKEMQQKTNVIIEWICSDKYKYMWKDKSIFYAEGGQYNTKSIGVGAFSPDCNCSDNLVFNTFIWSHFSVFRNSEKYYEIIACFNNYLNKTGLYKFPAKFISETKDAYLTSGGHMNVGENKKSNKYSELISSYWIYRIINN